MRFDRLSRPGPGLHRGWLFLTAAAYTLLGETLYQDNRPVTLSGLCDMNPADYAPLMLAWAALVCLVSTSWIAMRLSEPWLPRTALHTAAATSAGFAAAGIYYGVRSALGPECPGLEYCADCSGPSIWVYIGPVVFPTAIAVLLSPLIGYIARVLSTRIRERRVRREAAPDPGR
ncbi:MAG TPA: hypothetical protein VGO40_14890 [Longimicrobium sp.]|jgi:hypothetical protein|nr:hypothetical protein [Longimicrobium sp.]